MSLNNILPGKSKQSAGVTAESSCLSNEAASNRHITLLIALALAGIVLYCFGRTPGSYFLADDFGEICYIHRIFHAEPQLFWSNFTGNYMQIPGMSVYRPFLLLFLMLDYMLWGATASGYYLTNILYFTGCCLVIFFLARRLSLPIAGNRATLIAAFSAALFASYPLHSESVSWVVGRVDIICCFYYLTSLYLFSRALASSKLLTYALSCACFWIAICTKEMAIGLPVVATFMVFFLGDNSADKGTWFRQSFFSRVKTSLAYTSSLWCTTAFYFAVRWLTLSTLTGGYTGGIGTSQFSNIASRWCDLDTLKRLFFPLNYSVFHDAGIYPCLLAVIYLALLIIVAIRLLAGAMNTSWIAFLTLWLASTAAPIYQLWGLGYNLEGSRFFFFLSVPLSILAAVSILSPSGAGNHLGIVLRGRLTLAGSIFLSLLVILFARVSYLNNIPWVHAGKSVKSVQAQALHLAKNLPPGGKLILLGLPGEQGGAHQILNGATFAMMMNEPFVKGNHANSFITFAPALFGDPNLINAALLKQTLKNPCVRGMYFWCESKNHFLPVRPGEEDHALPAGKAGPATSSLQVEKHVASLGNWIPCTASGASFVSEPDCLLFHDPAVGDGMKLSGMHLNPLHVDFLELTMKAAAPDATNSKTLPGAHGAREERVIVSWQGDLCDGSTQSVECRLLAGIKPQVKLLVPLSRHWRWYAAGTIRSLTVHLQDTRSIAVTGARLLPEKAVSPALTIKGMTASNRGIFEAVPESTLLECDSSGIAGAAATQLEISRPNFFFEQFTEADNAVMNKITSTSPPGCIAIRRLKLSEHGYYQIRARCLDASGRPLGDFSDPITISHFTISH